MRSGRGRCYGALRPRLGYGAFDRGGTSRSHIPRLTQPTRLDSRPGRPVFNRTVTLRDTWARQGKDQK